MNDFIELVIWFVIILVSIMLVMAVRKIAVQYARRQQSGVMKRMCLDQDNTFL